MKTLNVTFSAAEVAEIIEAHLNRTLLGPQQRARASMISGCQATSLQPGLPCHELSVTFTVATEAAPPKPGTDKF